MTAFIAAGAGPGHGGVLVRTAKLGGVAPSGRLRSRCRAKMVRAFKCKTKWGQAPRFSRPVTLKSHLAAPELKISSFRTTKPATATQNLTHCFSRDHRASASLVPRILCDDVLAAASDRFCWKEKQHTHQHGFAIATLQDGWLHCRPDWYGRYGQDVCPET